MADISIKLQQKPEKRKAPPGTSGGEARKLYALGLEEHESLCKKLQMLEKTLTHKSQAVDDLRRATISYQDLPPDFENELQSLKEHAETDIGKIASIYARLEDHEEFLEEVQLYNGTQDPEANHGFKVFPRPYRFVRYLEVKYLQRIRASRSENSTTWTPREWER